MRMWAAVSRLGHTRMVTIPDCRVKGNRIK
jgi:hypothetical protein